MMSSHHTAPASQVETRRLPFVTSIRLRLQRWRALDVKVLARRIAYFWVVWSLLLIVHEGGHALAGARQGLVVRRVTVGVGPVIWSGHQGATEAVLRLVPIAGATQIAHGSPSDLVPSALSGWRVWRREMVAIGGGVTATLVLAFALAGAVLLRERGSGQRWTLGRMIVADAVVLTVFNFLPVPPLDGGRAMIEGVAALRGAPMHKEALFWVQMGGLALAVAPMTLWTRWTTRIDTAAMRWRAPEGASRFAVTDSA
jgi:membrane-associated protease RseP (regulator of RpoE activity)